MLRECFLKLSCTIYYSINSFIEAIFKPARPLDCLRLYENSRGREDVHENSCMHAACSALYYRLQFFMVIVIQRRTSVKLYIKLF